MRNSEESSNSIEVHKYTIVLFGSGNIILANQFSTLEVHPVVFFIEFISKSTFFFHVSSDIESIFSLVFTMVDYVDLVVECHVSGDSDCSIGVYGNHVLIRSQGKTDNERIDFDWIIVSSTSFSISVSQSDKGVDLSFLNIFGPCGDDEKSANNISVDGKEEKFIGGINSCLVLSSGILQIEPVLSSEQFIDLGPNIVESDIFFASSTRSRSIIHQIILIGGACSGSNREKYGNQNQDLSFFHNQQILNSFIDAERIQILKTKKNKENSYLS